jgi:competence protein ComEC
MSKPRRKPIFSALLLVGIVLVAALGYLPQWLHKDSLLDVFAPNSASEHGQTAFQVHFIDVGQGDCTLIAADGHYMLVDGGERGNEEKVTNYLRSQGVQRLDYVIATHPHSDHIGGLAYGVLEAFPVGVVIAPQLSPENTPTTQTYERFLRAVEALTKQGTKAVYAKPGTEYMLGGAAFTILGPLREDGENYNNDSVALRATYQNTSVLLCGDAEKPAEQALIASWGAALGSNILKAGHHGSKTSSTESFLRTVSPQALVISCGLSNTYGHPSRDILDRAKRFGIAVSRTDIDGTIVFVSDGAKIWLEEN